MELTPTHFIHEKSHDFYKIPKDYIIGVSLSLEYNQQQKYYYKLVLHPNLYSYNFSSHEEATTKYTEIYNWLKEPPQLKAL